MRGGGWRGDGGRVEGREGEWMGQEIELNREICSDGLAHLKFLRPHSAQDCSFDHVVLAEHALQAAFQHLHFVKSLIVFVRFLRKRQLDAPEHRIGMRAKNGLQGDGMKAEGDSQMNEEAAVVLAQCGHLKKRFALLRAEGCRFFREKRFKRHAEVKLGELQRRHAVADWEWRRSPSVRKHARAHVELRTASSNARQYVSRVTFIRAPIRSSSSCC